MIRWILLVLSLTATLCAQAGEVRARLSQHLINEGESVELTLEQDRSASARPDLSPLNEHFEVLATRQINRLSTASGSTQISTRWVIELMPKSVGALEIPPLQLGDQTSPALSLEVKPASAAQEHPDAPIFVHSTLAKNEVYVQAQALLTVRIYHRIALFNDSSLSELKLDQARIEPLGEPRNYEQTLDGQRYAVWELSYALYPQRSGELEIPALTFSASTVDERAGFFGARQGKRITVRSNPLVLNVKPRPAEFPSDAPWLAAQSLSLSEAWAPEPSQAKQGEALTRHLLIKADGLPAAQLPELPATDIAGLKVYPAPAKNHDQRDEQGLHGSREESQALVPNRSGNLTLPAITLWWWNTEKDRLERTELPERRLTIASNPQFEAEQSAPQTTDELAPPVLLWPWQLATALLSLTTVLGFALWWRARHLPAVLASASSGPSPRTLLDDIRRACQANDPQATRQALDAWARQQPETLAAMAARHPPLSTALDGLNGALYSETGQHWQGEELWKAVRQLPARDPEQPAGDSPLPPLYPR